MFLPTRSGLSVKYSDFCIYYNFGFEDGSESWKKMKTKKDDKVNKVASYPTRKNKNFQVSSRHGASSRWVARGNRRKKNRNKRREEKHLHHPVKNTLSHTKMGWRLKMELLARGEKDELVNVTSNAKSESLLGVWGAQQMSAPSPFEDYTTVRMMEWKPFPYSLLFRLEKRKKFHRWLSVEFPFMRL